jgi:nicotinamide-nucleotide amidase
VRPGPEVPQAARCLELLRARGQTLATAESLTAGLVSATVAAVPGASDVLRGGLTAYATDVKEGVLGIPSRVIAAHGAVSAECAEAMAMRARALFDADWAAATTGVAGPDSQEGKPAGLVFVAVAGPDRVRSRRLDLSGSRQQIRAASAGRVLQLLADVLTSRPQD